MSSHATSESVSERNGTPICTSSRRTPDVFTSVPLCASAIVTSSMSEKCGCAASKPPPPAVP